MIDKILTSSKQLYIPEEEICIDESMIKYHGKSSMTVFVKNKPIQCIRIYLTCFYIFKGGFRAFVLCESCSGYVLN